MYFVFPSLSLSLSVGFGRGIIELGFCRFVAVSFHVWFSGMGLGELGGSLERRAPKPQSFKVQVRKLWSSGF